MAPLAYYNLGIVAIQQTDLENAKYWLTKSYEQAEDENLRYLAETALARIEERKPQSLLEKYISVGLGYDDNVELLVNSETLETSSEGDTFADLFAFFRLPLTGAIPTHGSFMQTSLSYLKYFDLDEYDIGYANLELMYRKKSGRVQWEGGGGYGYTIIDGNSYEQSPGGTIQATIPFMTAESLRFRYRLHYLDIFDSDYDYLAGWRQQALAEISRSVSKYKAYLAYTLELNDRDDEDYSPTRHSIAAGLILKYFKDIDISLYFSYRDSSYDIDNTEDRDDHRIDTRVNFTYFLENGWEVSGKYQYVDNDSNYSSYDFTRNVVTLSVARFF